MDARSVLIALAGPMGGARARGVAAWAKPNLGRLRGADRAVAFDRARRVPCPRCDAAVEAAAGGCGWACEDMDAWTRRVIRAAWSFGADVLGPAWPAVEAVAAELMSSGEIGGDEVREIIRRSGAVGSTGCVGDRTGGVLAVVSARIDFGGRRRRR